MSIFFKLSFFVAFIAAVVVVLETTLPDLVHPLELSDLSNRKCHRCNVSHRTKLNRCINQIHVSDLKEWERGGRYVEVLDGYKMFVREGGKKGGETLILVHGYPTSSFDYERRG